MANDPQINDNVSPDMTNPDPTAGVKQPGRAGGKHAGRKKEEYFDYHDAMIQIEMIFQSHILSYGFKEYSIENFVDKKYFYSWKGKEGCSDTDAMRQGLNIDGILAKPDPTKNEILTYLQYTLNIAELCRRNFNADETRGYDFDLRNYTVLLSRIRELLARLKYDVKYISDKEVIYLVTKDVAMDAVAETSQDPAIDAIIEYNSYSVSGNLERKKSILNAMGDTIESYTDNRSPGNVRLFSNIEFMLYNFNIRNNNMDGDDKVDHVAAMSKEELEAWYDETYQLMLLRILQHNNEDRMKRIDAVQEACEATSVEDVKRTLDEEGEDRVVSNRRKEDLEFVARNVAEAAAIARGSAEEVSDIEQDTSGQLEEDIKEAQKKSAMSAGSETDSKKAEVYPEPVADAEVREVTAAPEVSEEVRPEKKETYTPSFRDVSDTASSAVSHTEDNSAGFVRDHRRPGLADYDEDAEDIDDNDDDDDDDLIEDKPKKRIGLMIFGTIAAILAVLFIAGFVVMHTYYNRANFIADTQIAENTDNLALAATVEDTGLTADDESALTETVTAQIEAAGVDMIGGKDVYNLLLVGVDRRDSSWYGNADCNILLSFNRTKKTITMMSFMRDLYAEIPGHGIRKLNAACAYGGCPLLVTTIENNYKIPIDNYAWVDFNGMIKIIDLLGGVDLRISDAEMQAANGYISEMARLNGEDPQQYFLLTSGDVHMSGYQAVGYARIRSIGNSDFGRTERQRVILAQIIGKIGSASTKEKASIIRRILPLVTHNIPESRIFGSIPTIMSLSGYKLQSARIPFDGLFTIDHEILVPDFATTLPIIEDILYGDGSSAYTDKVNATGFLPSDTGSVAATVDNASTVTESTVSESTVESVTASSGTDESGQTAESGQTTESSATTAAPTIEIEDPWDWVTAA